MIMTFKSISMDKDGMHKIKCIVEDTKTEADLKSTITIILEETDLVPSDSFEKIVERSIEIAKKMYNSR